jgi:hypothetical protein
VGNHLLSVWINLGLIFLIVICFELRVVITVYCIVVAFWEDSTPFYAGGLFVYLGYFYLVLTDEVFPDHLWIFVFEIFLECILYLFVVLQQRTTTT